MDELKSQVNLDNFDDYNMANVWYRAHLLKRNFRFTVKHKISTTATINKILELIGGVLNAQIVLTEDGRTLTFAEINDHAATLIISETKDSEHSVYISTALEGQQEPFKKIIDGLPKFEKKENETPVTFMYATETRIVKKNRNIAVPTWSEIQDNYSKNLSSSISRLFELKPPVNHGKIILWHGKPGTGKSHALRSLLRQWKWCDPYYIIDPEALFKSPAYLMDIIFENKEDEFSIPELNAPSNTDKWKLFIMEDADEFLTSDAKQFQGQNISRLLNLSDGLIGQGLNILLLFTTNEPIENLHPAIIRAGRCLADIEFTSFSSEESLEWMKNKGIDQSAISSHNKNENTLADLYAKLNKMDKIQHDVAKTRVGFHV